MNYKIKEKILKEVEEDTFFVIHSSRREDD